MAGRRAKTGDISIDKGEGSNFGQDGVVEKRPRPAQVDYRQLFERGADAVLITDSDGHYVDANPRACELTGYSKDELVEMHIGDLAVPSERSLSEERFALLQQTGRTRRDRILQRKDGTRITVEAHATALGQGLYQTTIRDVSERVEGEEALRRSLDAHATLVDLCNAAVVSAGPDGKITSWNPAAEALFGYGEHEALRMPLGELISTQWRSRHNAAYGRHVKAGTAKPFHRILETEALAKDGTEIAVEISLAVGGHGPEQVFTAVIRDMREQHKVLEQLNDALQQLQFHVERMPLAYIVWDTDFNAIEWNPAAEQAFGYSRSEAIGRSAFDLIVPTDPEVVEAIERIWHNLLAGDTSSHSVNANIRKDGSKLICEWFNTRLRDSRGHIRGVASMAMDVSEREASEAQIRDAQKLESLGVLAGGVAHDFNSSLMVILGNASLLRATPGLPSKAAEYVELIENAGLRAGKFIGHLLTYARTGRHNPQPTDLNDVLTDVATLVRSAMGNKHELVLTVADKLPKILADRSQIEQVVLNLCLNAKQAEPADHTIGVTTRLTDLTSEQAKSCVPYKPEQGTYVELEVRDDGVGMDEATLRRIFVPFFTTRTEGHGLGLAAVLGILRQHGAAAHIESKPGSGTQFRVFFPIHRQAPENSQRRRRRGKAKRSG